MKIACRWLCTAAAGLLLCGTALGQQARWPDSYELGGSDYPVFIQDAKPEGKKPSDVEPIGPPSENGKKAPEKKADAKSKADAPAAEEGCGKSEDTGCCDKSEGNGCCDKSNGNGCCGKSEEDECKCSCYLFGPSEAVSVWDEMWDHCEDECKPRVRMGGWVSAGHHNKNTPLSNTYGDELAFNDVPGKVHVHQAWLWAERAVDTSKCDFDWGFRADLMYGTDANTTQAYGNPPQARAEGWDNQWDNGVYGWAFPQAYGVLAYQDLTVKIGHFYTTIGYEVVQATGNFFYSHSLTFYNSEPFTHTGALADYKVNDKLTATFGWTAGWDTGFAQFDDGSNFLGGFTYQISDDAKFVYMNTLGDFGRRGTHGYMQSVVFDWNINDNWEYVFQSDILRIQDAPYGAGHLGDDAESVLNYLFYKYNDCWKFGVRTEWWQTNGTSYHEVTYGVNYRPSANLVIRPEYRNNWSPATDLRRDVFAVDAVFVW